jgi:hypothetical protein
MAKPTNPRIIPSGIQPARNASRVRITAVKISGYPSLAILIGTIGLRPTAKQFKAFKPFQSFKTPPTITLANS